MAVTKDPAFESPGRLRELGAEELVVVQSSAAWEAYSIPGSPYFVYIDGATGTVGGEGTALDFDQLQSLLGDALLDTQPAVAIPRGETGGDRAARAEQALQAAGVPFDDASFFQLNEHERATLEQ